MHTFNGDKTRIFHNGDFSGDCEIMNTETQASVTVPCDDILAFAAEYVRSERIRSLGQMDPEELLGLSKSRKLRKSDYLMRRTRRI